MVALCSERLEERSRAVASVCGFRCSRHGLTIAKRALAVCYIAVIPLLLPALALYREFFQKCGRAEAIEYLRDFDAIPFVFKLLSIWWISLFLLAPVGFLVMAIVAVLVDVCTCHGRCCGDGDGETSEVARTMLSAVVGSTKQALFHLSPSEERDVGGFSRGAGGLGGGQAGGGLGGEYQNTGSQARLGFGGAGGTSSQFGHEAISVDVLLPSHHRTQVFSPSPKHGSGGVYPSGVIAPAAVSSSNPNYYTTHSHHHRRHSSITAPPIMDDLDAPDSSAAISAAAAAAAAAASGGGGEDGGDGGTLTTESEPDPRSQPPAVVSGGGAVGATSRSDMGGGGGGVDPQALLQQQQRRSSVGERTPLRRH